MIRPSTVTSNDTTEATNLLSLANDVAVGKGKDLATVADALAKASQGNTRGLKDLGVELKNADGSAKSFESISQELVQLYGGSAKKAFDADPAKQLQVQMENLKETVGNALLPVVKNLAGAAGDLLGWFNGLGSGAQQLIVWIGLVGGAGMAAVKAFTAMKSALEGLGVAAESTQPWLIGIGIAVGAVIAAVSIFSDEESAATQRAHNFNDAIHAGSNELDLHTIAMQDATAAAKEFGDVANAELDKKVRDSIMPNEQLVDALNALGVSIDTVVAATHGDVDAQAALVAARQRAADQGLVEVKAWKERGLSQAQAEAEKAKAAGGGGAEGADKGKDKGEQKTLVETVAQISLKDLSPEVQGLLDGERKARERLERELADQKKASAEAKRLQEDALKSEQKRIAIENLTGALCEAKPGLPKTAAKLLARTMIEDGQVKIDGGRARYVITDPDAEFEEDRVKEISISDGAKRWAGTAESDELVPAPVSGPGVLRDNMGGRSRNSQVKIEDMSPVEQMSDALASVFGSRK